MDPQQLVQSSKYMQGLLEAAPLGEEKEEIIRLDLADEAQYSFLQGRLQASGKTVKNSPELFARLEKARQRALARASLTKTEGAGAQVVDSQWCSHFLYMVATGTSGSKTQYAVAPVVACNGGASYVYADVVAYDTNAAETESIPAGSASGEQYGGGKDFGSSLKITPSIDSQGGRVLRAESLLIALDDVNGNDQTSYALLRSAASPSVERMSLTHPRKLITNKQDIIVCQQRGGSDCDYAVAGFNSSGSLVAYPSSPTVVAAAKTGTSSWALDPATYWNMGAAYNYSRLYLPLRGTFDSGARGTNCRITRYEGALARLHLVNTGRVCYVESSFINQLTTGQRTSNFNFLADFSNTPTGLDPACSTERIVNEPVRLWLTVQAWADCGLGFEEPRFLTATHDGALNATNPTRIFYRNSCMAQGTGITLADGRVVPVEQVQQGDKVVADNAGTVLTVTDVARGNEAHPFVMLRDNAGHQVSLTETHPVLLASGKMVPAKALKAKDQVKTDKGVARLTSVSRVPADRQVFNLTLGTDEELLKVAKNGRTMFAGGFLVGDNATQVELEQPAPAPVAELPKAWRKDFQLRVKLAPASNR